MADNKQYISKVQDTGTVMISEDVIITIVSQAVSEVEGVVGMSTKPGADIVDLLGMKNWGKGIRIVIGEDNAVTVDCNVVLAYGQSVVTVAGAIQSAVTAAIESMAGVKVVAVNVNICGIVRQ